MNAKGAPLKLQLDFVLEDYRKTEVTGAAIGDKVEQLSTVFRKMHDHRIMVL